jgi:hypothetical protein
MEVKLKMGASSLLTIENEKVNFVSMLEASQFDLAVT